MSDQDVILVLLGIIGALSCGLVMYFIGNTQKQFIDIQTWITNLSNKFDEHIKDCKFQDKRT